MSRKKKSYGKRRLGERRLSVEPLEDRRMLATITVGSLNDAGAGSLREAITTANGNGEADTILFSVAGRIYLDSQLPTITQAVTIDGGRRITLDAGDGADGVFATGDGFRIFNINNGNGTQIEVILRGLKLTGGDTLDETSGFGGESSGGAIRSAENLTLIDSKVERNATGDSSTLLIGRGGGIFSYGPLSLIETTVSGNRTGNGGTRDGGDGGGIFGRGTVSLTRSTVSGNFTGSGANGGDGGGIFSDGPLTLTSSTVSGNFTGSGGDGGGIYSGGTLSISGSTITGNNAGASAFGGCLVCGDGGGIWSGNSSITITHSIVADNIGTADSPDIRPGTAALNVDFSLTTQIGLPLAGSGNIVGASPDLAPLANNGGPTKTHALRAGSPAIDAGDANAGGFDQRGAPFSRVFDDPGAPGSAIDIGAYERQSFAGNSFLVDLNVDESNGNFAAGDLSLREALSMANGSVGPDTITFSTALAGATIFVRSELSIADAVTIDGDQQITLDAGDGSDRIFGTGDGFRIFKIDDGDPPETDVTLRGLTLTGGDTMVNKTNRSYESHGGAIFSDENLMLIDSNVTGNATGDGKNAAVRAVSGANGGGIFSLGTLTLIRSMVTGNKAGDGGSGIFSAGIATGGDGGNGGGIYSRGTLTLNESTVSGNKAGAGGEGGGTNNSSFGYGGTGGSGGGIMNFSSFNRALEISSSTLSGNSAGAGGFSGKTNQIGAGGNGGGAYSVNEIALSHSTVTNNIAAATGGGIWNNDDPINIANSIVGGNTAGNRSPDIRPGTGALNVSYSLIQQVGLAFVGAGNISGVSPNLGPLADNGGTTQTHALLSGSPAVDAGDPGVAFDVNEFDQRGTPFARVADGGVRGQRIDIGAYELQATGLPCDFVGSGNGCNIDDIDALFAGTNGAPGPLTDALVGQWLVDASVAANPLKQNASDVYVLGDANLDGRVDSTDLGLLLNNFGATAGVGWGSGNLNSDASINSTDLGLLLNNFGHTSFAVAAGSATVTAPLFHATDINQDGSVSPTDAFAIINYLNHASASNQPETNRVSWTERLDVNADDEVSPLDALAVINHLNAFAIITPETTYSSMADLDDEETDDATGFQLTDWVFANISTR